jgi:hypothetical protein
MHHLKGLQCHHARVGPIRANEEKSLPKYLGQLVQVAQCQVNQVHCDCSHPNFLCCGVPDFLPYSLLTLWAWEGGMREGLEGTLFLALDSISTLLLSLDSGTLTAESELLEMLL